MLPKIIVEKTNVSKEKFKLSKEMLDSMKNRTDKLSVYKHWEMQRT